MNDSPIKNLTDKFQSLKKQGEEITGKLDKAFSNLEKRNIKTPTGSFEKKVKESKKAVDRQLGK